MLANIVHNTVADTGSVLRVCVGMILYIYMWSTSKCFGLANFTVEGKWLIEATDILSVDTTSFQWAHDRISKRSILDVFYLSCILRIMQVSQKQQT